MKVDFNQIKTTISLPDFLLELGWKIVEGSSNSCLLYTSNQLKVSTAKDAVAYSNLFVVDKAMNTYHITIKRGNTSVFTYNFEMCIRDR